MFVIGLKGGKSIGLIFREGFGVTLLVDIPEETLRQEKYPVNIKPGYMQDTITTVKGSITLQTLVDITI